MTAAGALGRVADFLLETRLADVPADVAEDARLSLLDTVGCMLGGSTAGPARALMESVAEPAGAAPLLGTRLRTSPPYAALAGFVAGAWLDLDGGHPHPGAAPPVPGIQPALHVVPVLFAIAEEAGATGERMLLAYLLGREVAARLSVATRLRPGLHGHGMQATVGAAAAAALLLGAGRERLETTLRLAAGLCLMGPMRAALEGATVRNAFGGMGALNGLLALGLARRGFTAARDQPRAVFEEVGSTRYDPAMLVGGLGREWESRRGYYKVHACCRWAHPALDALERVLDAAPLGAGEIDRIDVRTFAFAAALDDREPRSELAARFSIPYALAARAALGSSGFRAFGDEARRRPDVRALARRVHVREDPAHSAALPGRRPATVAVHARSGTTWSATVQGSRGDHTDPLPRRDLEAKFLELSAAALGEAGGARALAALRAVDRAGHARALVQALTPSPGAGA